MFKQAHVNTRFTKTTMPKDNLRNYTHVSDLSFISKISETLSSSTNRYAGHDSLNSPAVSKRRRPKCLPPRDSRTGLGETA